MSLFSALRNQFQNLPVSLTPDDCKGKTYIVTGANGGLGYECTKHLVRLQAARVIMAVRNLEAGEEAKKTIENETGRTDALHVWRLDLASFDSVRKFVERVEAEVDRVDALVQNAAIAMGEWIEAEQGCETNMTVNVLSAVLLTVLMMPYLQRVGKKFGTVPRIAIIGSEVAFLPESKTCLEKLDRGGIFNDVSDKAKWEPLFQYFYPFSKLLLYAAYRKLTTLAPVSRSGVVINYSNPGLCNTGLSRHVGIALRLRIELAKLIMGRTAEMGSRTLLAGISAPEDSHGSYLSECVIKDDSVPDWATNEDGQRLADETWKATTERLERFQPGCVSAVVNL